LKTVPLLVKRHTATIDEAKQELWNVPDFAPPFQVTLAQFGIPDGEDRERPEGALVNIVVTHMFSDGYSIMPILEELAHLVAKAEGADGPHLSPLPPLPNPFETIERRVLRTIHGDHSMRDAMTNEAIGKSKAAYRREVATTIATMPAEVVAALKVAGRSLAVADDIAMLAVVGTTLARWRSQAAITIAMIVPQRDGPSEGDLVGLFADIRLLDVCTAGLSFAGAALRLQHIVKERLWTTPPVGTQFNDPLINFEWTDFDSRQGFVQLPHMRTGPENGVINPLKIAVDQADRSNWRMRVAFDTAVYDKADQDSFFSALEVCLRALVTDSLSLVWPLENHGDCNPQPSETAAEAGSKDALEDFQLRDALRFSTTEENVAPPEAEGGTGGSAEPENL
jgi:hypothetical protein